MQFDWGLIQLIEMSKPVSLSMTSVLRAFQMTNQPIQQLLEWVLRMCREVALSLLMVLGILGKMKLGKMLTPQVLLFLLNLDQHELR